MAKRYVTTLMGRLKKMTPVEPKFDYGERDVGVAKRQSIADALSFWKFYNELSEHTHKIKNIPEDMNDLRHELLAHVAEENSLRGFVACWLRLPVTVVQTLKQSLNLDVQSRESFLRRLLRTQYDGVKDAYAEFFEHQQVPACMSDGVVRRLVHREVTYASLAAESLTDYKRTESRSAWSKDYGNLGFGHARYPEGPGDDTSDSGALRKFLSVKNHANDFSVNQHDGLYWILYRTLRSNYLWNRGGDVQLKPMICPGFWVTILSVLFFTVVSPLLALFVFFPLISGGMDLTFRTFVGGALGAVTPFLLLLYGIFYFFRDSRTIRWIEGALDRHVDRYARAWVLGFKAVAFTVISLFVTSITVSVFASESMPWVYGVIPMIWLGAYWVKAIKERDVFFGVYADEKRSIGCLMLATIVLLLLPFTFDILGFLGTSAMAVVWMLANYPMQVLLLAVSVAVAGVVYWKTEHVRGYQTARSGVNAQNVKRDTQVLVGIVCLAVCFYTAVGLWALSSLMVFETPQTHGLYSFSLLALVGAITWFVLRDAHNVRKLDAELVVKRSAYMNALREAGLEYQPFYKELMDNDWVITQEDVLKAADTVRSFVGGLESHIFDHRQELYFRTLASYTIDESTVKQIPSYTWEKNRDAYYELGQDYYFEYALGAIEGYTPEKALEKACKLKKLRERKRSFWANTLVVRAVVGVFNAIGCFFGAIDKFFRDMLGMWHIMHKYCPAVSETKQI